jgi:hypothetical protein
MSLLFGFSTPKTIFVMIACELSTRCLHFTGCANFASHRFSLLTSLRSLGWCWKKYIAESTTGCIVHPLVIGFKPFDEEV